MRGGRLGVLVALGMLVTPAGAQAGTLHYAAGAHQPPPPAECGYHQSCAAVPDQPGVVTYEAGPGEVNDVSTTFGDPQPDSLPGTVVLSDTAGVALAGDADAACSRVDPRTVRCASTVAGLGIVVRVTLGDEDDRADGGAAGPLSADGGPGDDVLTGLRLLGGPGRDVLTASGPAWLDGGPGRDSVTGSPGRDTIVSQGGRRGSGDRIDGGEGIDTLSYNPTDYAGGDGPAVRVTVDLAGLGRSTDAVSGVEDVVGSGSAGDWIRGDDGPNRLAAGDGPGPVVIDGRGGDDRIDATGAAGLFTGGDGDDRLTVPPPIRGAWQATGGAGDDVLDVAPWGGIADCGDGRDLARTNLDATPGPADPVLLVPADCERTTGDPRVSGSPRVVRHRRSVAAFVRCPPHDAARVQRCPMRARVLAADGRVLGSARVVVAAGRQRRLIVTLPPGHAADPLGLLLTRRDEFRYAPAQLDRRLVHLG